MAQADSEHDSDEYEDDPDLSPPDLARRRYKRWCVELEAAEAQFKDFRHEGVEALKQFRRERSNQEVEWSVKQDRLRRLPVFSSDIQVQCAQLFGAVPKVDVSRRYGDSADQPARIAGEILQRILNSDIEHDERTFSSTVERALFDFRVPGMGLSMCRYVPSDESRDEDSEAFYVHWGDVLMSPCRIWEERRWIRFGCEMSRQDLLDNFAKPLGEMLLSGESDDIPELAGEPPQPPMLGDSLMPEQQAAFEQAQQQWEAQKAARDDWEARALELGRQKVKTIPLNAQRGTGKGDSKGNDLKDKSKQHYPWDRAYVEEIWDIDRKQVTRLVRGFDMVLQCIPDPLGLEGFFPLPEPMMANLTNDKCVPTSDWVMAQELYDEVDSLTARIADLERACRIAGCYDKTQAEVGRIFDEAAENLLVPVDNWAGFIGKGGIQGAIQLVPLKEIIEVIEVLSRKRIETLDLLRTITGQADITKGQQVENGTPGEAAIKYQAASIRIRQWQKRFARFVSELQAIKAEIICKKFSTETILKRANVSYMVDAQPSPDPQVQAQRKQMLEQAVQLLRDRFHEYRIQVRPESIAAEDYATMKAERSEYLEAVGTMFEKAQGIAQAIPGLLPGMLQLAKWAAEGLKGGKEVEGLFHEMINVAAQAAAQKAAQPPQQNPESAQIAARQAEIAAKAKADAQRIQLETQADIERNKAETQDAAQLAQQKQQLDIQTAQAKEVIRQRAAATAPAIHPTHPAAKPQ